jgi:hypothetical protein
VFGDGTNRLNTGFSGAPDDDVRMITHIPPAPRTKAARIRTGVDSSDHSAGRFAFLGRFAITEDL